MIGWIRLLDDKIALVAGSGVALEGEVEAAIVVTRTLTLTVSIPLLAIFSSRQEIEGGSVFLPESLKQLSFALRCQIRRKVVCNNPDESRNLKSYSTSLWRV